MPEPRAERPSPTIGVGSSPAGVEVIREALRLARTVFSIAHPFSDGDALGSQLAIQQFCRWQGKTCLSLNFDPIPSQISWLPGSEALVDRLPEGQTFDLAFLMETTEASRMGDRVQLFPRARTCIHLDHHIGVKPLGQINLLDDRASSTCELLYGILQNLAGRLPLEILEPLYVGIMTDTGNFRYPNTTPQAHRIAAEMIADGLAIAPIYQRVYENNGYARIVLHGTAMSRAVRLNQGRLVYSWLTVEDFDRLGATEVDSDGSVTPLTNMVGVEAAVLFRELADGRIKASFRSNGKVDVRAVCSRFGGGGHILAAGANLPGPLTQAVEKVLAELEPAVAAAAQG